MKLVLRIDNTLAHQYPDPPASVTAQGTTFVKTGDEYSVPAGEYEVVLGGDWISIVGTQVGISRDYVLDWGGASDNDWQIQLWDDGRLVERSENSQGPVE